MAGLKRSAQGSLPCSRHADRNSRGDGQTEIEILAVRSAEHVRPGLGRRSFAAVVGRGPAGSRVVVDEKAAAADARGLRFDHAQHHLDRNRRIHRGAAAFEHVDARLDCHRVRRRHHALRFGGCGPAEIQQCEAENDGAAESHAASLMRDGRR
jgi:hypothetical protein